MKTFLVMAEDAAARGKISALAKEKGWKLLEATDCQKALALVKESRPDVIVCDFLMAGCNSAFFCRTVRADKTMPDYAPIILALGPGFSIDRAHALEAGADDYLHHPIESEKLTEALTRRASDKSAATAPDKAPAGTRLKFWGVRGSIPTPGTETVMYGGNTSCLEVRVNGEIIILDAGSGIRRLGLSLAREFKGQPMNLSVLITHTHWDHIQGFPFFVPAYNPKNTVTIYGFEGARQGLQSTLSSQMESPYFPISMQQMPGNITIQEVKEMNFQVNSVPVRAQFVNHPGICAGYRLSTPGGTIAYIPDVELFERLRLKSQTDTELLTMEDRQFSHEADKKLIEFIMNSDVLVLDSQYDAAEYQSHIGWGHSCVEDSVAFALKARVKRLFLFHHDPDHTDEHISKMVARARQMVARRKSSLIVEAAREGLELYL